MRIRPVTSPPRSDSLLFAGDYVRSDYFDSPPLEETLRRHVRSAATSFVNLEAPIDTGTPSAKHGPVLGQPPREPRELAEMGFESVTLANNHIMDHGEEGLTATLNACDRAGLETVGAGPDRTAAIEPITLSIANSEVAVFNACEREFGIADESAPGAVWIGEAEFERAVERAIDRYDVVIVVAHGGIEYVPLPPPSWQRRLRRFADFGVDAVIAHHPHVALPWEVYREVPIFYSLGNFVFHNASRPETSWTYLLEPKIKDGAISTVGMRLVETSDGKVREMSDQDRGAQWKYLSELSELTETAPSNPGYWQEIAVRIFDERYHGRIDDYGNGHLLSSVRNPIYQIDRLTRGLLSREDRIRTQQLAVLNYVRSGSHRDVIESALAVNTGVATDHRTPEIRRTIDRYFKRVDTTYGWSRLNRARWYVKKGLNRLSP